MKSSDIIILDSLTMHIHYAFFKNIILMIYTCIYVEIQEQIINEYLLITTRSNNYTNVLKIQQMSL